MAFCDKKKACFWFEVLKRGLFGSNRRCFWFVFGFRPVFGPFLCVVLKRGQTGNAQKKRGSPESSHAHFPVAALRFASAKWAGLRTSRPGVEHRGAMILNGWNQIPAKMRSMTGPPSIIHPPRGHDLDGFCGASASENGWLFPFIYIQFWG